MYFSPQDYLKFVVDLKTYLNCRMEFVEPNDSKNRHLFSQDNSFGNYPIAKLGDIEIAMLHFPTKDEAIAKWNRRVERVCWDNLIIKMNDQNGCSYEDAKFFLDTPMQCKVKIFFSAKKAWQKKDNRIIYIPQLNSNHVCASKEPFGKSKICNINDIINAL